MTAQFAFFLHLCRLNIPRHMIPQTEHPTILSVLHSDNPTVLNVLVDVVILLSDFPSDLLIFYFLTILYDGIHILVLFSGYFRVMLRGKYWQRTMRWERQLLLGKGSQI